MRSSLCYCVRRVIYLFVLSVLTVLSHPLNAEIVSVEYQRDVYFNSDPHSGAPLDVTYSTPPSWQSTLQIPTHQERLQLNLVAGATPYYLKGSVRFKFIWDTDSVSPGGSFVVKVVAETDSAFKGNPYYGGSHEIYSAYGFQTGIGLQRRSRKNISLYPPSSGWTSWEDTPIGIGIDACLNIKADGRLPMHNESLTGEDEINVISVGADMLAGGKNLKDQHGNPIPKSAESNILGLISLLDLGIKIGYKLADGVIHAYIEPWWPFELDPNYHNNNGFIWYNRGDTVYLHLKVDPLATNLDTGYIRIRDGFVRENVYYRERGYVSLLGFSNTFLTSDWLPMRNGYEDLSWDQDFPLIQIPVTGSSQAHVDLYIDPHYLSMWHTVQRGNYTSFVKIPEVGGITGIGLKVKNKGNITSSGYVIKWIFPDTTYVEDRRGFVTIPPGGHDDVSHGSPVWTHEGNMNITVIIIPDSSEHDPNPHNDTLHLRVFVTKHRITTLIALIDYSTGDTITPSSSIFDTVYTIGPYFYMQAVPDTTYNQWDRWVAFIPEDQSVNVTAIPDTSYHRFAQTTKHIEMDTVSSDPFYLYIPAWGNSGIEGYVTYENGDPAESTKVILSNFYSTYTDSTGFYRFYKRIPANYNLNGSPYYLKFYRPGYRFDSIALYLRPDSIYHIDHQLVNIDTIPPYGSLNISSIIKKHTTFTFVAMDTFTQWGDTLPPAKVFVKDGGSDWTSFDYGEDFEFSINWNMHTRTSHNEVDTIWVKFADIAGNESDSLMYVVTVDQDGPQGTFYINNNDSVTANPEVRITNVTINSTLVPVKYVQVWEDGGRTVVYPYNSGATYTYMLNGNSGLHNVYVSFIDSLGVSSSPQDRSILLDYYGAVYINDDSTYTNSSTVDLKIDAVGILASNASGTQGFGNYPLAQSFIPHSNQISAISVYMHADSGAKIGLFTLVDTSFSPEPGETLILDTIRETVNGWVKIDYPNPISVYPDSSYMIVIFQDSLEETWNNIDILAGSDENYLEGHLYYSPAKKGYFWYETGYDILFKVMGRPDSMRISNAPDFTTGTGWIPYQMIYPNWNLSPGEGLRTVYAQVKINGETRTYHDAITVDYTPPDTAFAILLNRSPFLETTECTLRLYAWDGGSGIKDYRINGSSWYPMPVDNPFTTTFNVDSGAPGPREINVVFRDKADNEYNVPTITIDYDPDGPTGSLTLGYNGYSSSETVTVHIDLDKVNGKAITVDSMRFSSDRRTWSEWQAYSSSSEYIFDHIGTAILYVELQDNYGKRSILSSACLIDTTPPYTPIRVYDEGDETSSHDSLTFWWTCYGDYESGIDHFVIKISKDSLVRRGLIEFNVPADVRSYRVGPMTLRGDSTYYARIVAVNRVGLISESEPTDGITVLNGIQHFNLISPQDSSQFQQNDTITLVWHEPTDILSSITNYFVFIDSQMVANITDTTWTVSTNLQEGWHRWYVVAQDSLLDQRYSDTMHFYIGTVQPPPIPVPHFPSDTFLSNNSVTFVWSPGTKETEFKLASKKDRKDSKKDFKSLKSTSYILEVASDSQFTNIVDSLSTSDTTLTTEVPEGRLFWRVMARDEFGSSDWSSVLTFAVDTTSPGQPIIISPPTGDTLTSDSVEFSWFPAGDNFGVSMYRLDYWGSQSGSIETPDTFDMLELGSGTFYFTITAFDSAGNSSISDTSWFVIEHITLPAPVLISPPDDSMTNYLYNIHFVWQPGSKNSHRNELSDEVKTPSRQFIFQLAAWDSTFSSTEVCDTISDTTMVLNVPEGRLYWRVREIDSQGNLSPWTDYRRFIADTTRPSPPYQISPEDSAVFDTNIVVFRWHSSYDALSGLNYYQLEYERLNGDTSEYYNINLTDTVISVEIPRNGEWMWCVVAFDSAGNTKFSGWRRFTMNYQPPLPVPTLIEPVDNQWVQSMVTFRWQVSGEKSYPQDNLSLNGVKDTLSYILEVWRGEQIVIHDTLSQDSFTTFIWQSGNYYWHVQTYFAGRTSEWSSIDSFRVDAEAPHASTLIYPGYGYYITSLPYQFVWTSSFDTLSGFAGYRLLIANNPDMMEPVIDTTLFDTTYTLTNLEDGTWYWQVRNYDSVGNGEFSEIAMFYIDTTPPEPVQLIAPPDSTLYGFGDTPTFIWHSTEARKLIFHDKTLKTNAITKEKFKSFEQKQQVYYELIITGNEGDTLVFSEIEDTTYDLDTLLEDGWYSWWVRAYDEAGNYSSSEVWVFGTDTTPPVIESTTVWHDTSFAGPFLVRTHVTDANGVSEVKLFYIFESDTGVFDSLQMQPDSIDDFYYAFIPQVTGEETICYYIRALDNAWEPNEAYDPEDGEYCFVVTPVGIGSGFHLPFKFDFKGITPNPARREFSLLLAIPERSEVGVEVFDACGRKVEHRKFVLDPGFRKLDLKAPARSGVYFVIVTSGNRRFVRRLIVTR